MNRRFSQFLASCLLIGLLAVSASAQFPPARPRAQRPPLSEEAQWALLVHQSGGFAGLSQAVTIDSTGVLKCVGFQTPCGGEIAPDTLDRLDTEIENTVPDDWSRSLVPCSDCLTRMVILVLKGSEGLNVEHIAYWNVAIPAATSARELHQVVRNLLFPE